MQRRLRAIRRMLGRTAKRTAPSTGNGSFNGTTTGPSTWGLSTLHPCSNPFVFAPEGESQEVVPDGEATGSKDDKTPLWWPPHAPRLNTSYRVGSPDLRAAPVQQALFPSQAGRSLSAKRIAGADTVFLDMYTKQIPSLSNIYTYPGQEYLQGDHTNENFQPLYRVLLLRERKGPRSSAAHGYAPTLPASTMHHTLLPFAPAPTFPIYPEIATRQIRPGLEENAPSSQ